MSLDTDIQTKNKKKIHFILPGGGVKGSFQAGFLYHLFKNYSKDFEIAGIDGTSVGSVNGFTIITAIKTDNLEKLKETWTTIKSLNDLFGMWSDNYIIGKLSSLYYGFYNKGLFNNEKLKSMLETNIKPYLNELPKEILEKYNCVVVNTSNGQTEYINGTNPKIIDYIVASASPWVISNPQLIDNIYYTDGGISETYPIDRVLKENLECDLRIIVGYDQEHFNYKGNPTNNLLEYLASLIDIARLYQVNTLKTKELVENCKCIPIINPMEVSFADFNREVIIEGFKMGEQCAEDFYNVYIKS